MSTAMQETAISVTGLNGGERLTRFSVPKEDEEAIISIMRERLPLLPAAYKNSHMAFMLKTHAGFIFPSSDELRDAIERGERHYFVWSKDS